MKKYIVALLLASFCSVVTNQVSAQNTASRNDSIAHSVKLKALHAKRDSIMQRINVEDAKRNTQINGVTPERQEELNNRQDSICLSLRSQLVDVVLEIKEIAPDVATPQLIQQYNNLLGKKRESKKK